MRELFLDCSGGIAGDMLCAALLELCPNREELLEKLNRTGIPGIKYSLEPIKRYGITGSHLQVTYNGIEETQDYKAADEHQHGKHSHHHYCHDASSLHGIMHILEHVQISENVKKRAKEIYNIIAEAECHVHVNDMEHIHFHELGTMDAIADICAACLLIEELAIDKITFSPICTGFGRIKCAHGLMPIPAPATALILEGIPCFAGEIEGELCTPTGAALAKCFANEFAQMPLMKIQHVGYGMGTKDFGAYSAVRAIIGESVG